MKRRDLFKMLGTMAAAPFVAPLVAMCKPKQDLVSVCMPAMDVLAYEPSNFKLRPPVEQKASIAISLPLDKLPPEVAAKIVEMTGVTWNPKYAGEMVVNLIRGEQP